MHWLRMFHWCLVRLEKEESAGGEDEKLGVRRRQRQRRQRLTELDAAVFQLTLEVKFLLMCYKWWLCAVCRCMIPGTSFLFFIF